MNTETVPQEQKFMRPRPYAKRIDVSVRSVYHYVDQKIFPAYKFQGVLLLDVEECDAIVRGMRRREIKTSPKISRRQGKQGAQA
jgi:hypothetical protein